MKLASFTTAALLVVTINLVAPVKAQNPEPITPGTTPLQPTQLTSDQVLQACAQDRADTLPNPYSRDLQPNHWAYKAVLSMHYCGAYRGSVPPAQVKPFLEQQNLERPQANS